MIQFPEEACSLIISEVLENSHILDNERHYLCADLEANDMEKLKKRIKEIIEAEINEVDSDFLYEMEQERTEEARIEEDMDKRHEAEEKLNEAQADDDKRRAEASEEKDCSDAL